MFAVIMAGGSGTRFWPYSRQLRPKQLLRIFGEKNMLQITVDRLLKVKAVEDIFIVTRKDLADNIRNEISGVPPENVLVEPEGKNTAPCIGLAALHISGLKKNAVMGIFPADHLMVGHAKFEKAINSANHLAKKNGSLVTLGIKPTYPSTGYGYIQFDPESEEDHLDGYTVRTFAEKPHLELAKRFIKSGDFLWNAGMFIWKVDTFFREIKIHMSDLYENLSAIRERLKKQQNFDDIWEHIFPQSIDYGLMEKSKNIYVIKAEFEWNDLGSWNSVYDVSSKSEEGNVTKGDGVILDGRNNFIQSNGRFTAVVGLDNLVVVNTDDATLVIPRDKVEDIRELVQWLKKQDRTELL